MKILNVPNIVSIKHKYFYAYFWDSKFKKLKKKYIGKHLPPPFNFLYNL